MWLLKKKIYANFILSGGRFIHKMSFGSTFLSQNYPDDPVGEI